MASISKAQAKALAEGFLDNIGSSKEGFAPRNTLTELFLLAGELIEDCQDNLNRANITNTGKLSESLIADEPTQNGSTVRIDVLMNFYGAFHNKGVKGTRAGRSTAGYSFKNEIVSDKMYNAIDKWIKRAGRTTRTVKKYKGYGAHETKRKSIAQYDNTYATARSIKMYGLKPTGFLDKAVVTTKHKVSDRLGAALKIDVIDGLRDK
jgi:hypothetical protein